MSSVFRGYQGVVLVKQAPRYNAETKVFTWVREYQGSEAAVRGAEPELRDSGLSYRTDHDGPVWTLYVEEPEQDSDQDIDRWEIFTESTEKSLFELPDAIAEAELWDAGILTGENAYKAVVESAVSSRDTEIDNQANWPTAYQIIRHLRAGVTGWQLDLVGIRRTRKMQTNLAGNYRLTLDTGLYIYSTNQLGVPDAVAFGLPATPSAPSADFAWGWRKRSQRVEIVGSFIDQTVDLLFAPWSLLAYSQSQYDLAW